MTTRPQMTAFSFGDNVRIRATDETVARGLAGRCGPVWGETTPSATGVAVIGTLRGDYAVNVHFDDLDAEFWFAPELLEFLDHGAGTEVTVEGVDGKMVRRSDGGWAHQPGNPSSAGRTFLRPLRRLVDYFRGR
jgi:hypothetical protein